jgi:hypothetical protein
MLYCHVSGQGKQAGAGHLQTQQLLSISEPGRDVFCQTIFCRTDRARAHSKPNRRRDYDGTVIGHCLRSRKTLPCLLLWTPNIYDLTNSPAFSALQPACYIHL